MNKPTSKAERLCMDYANNAARIRDVNQQINTLDVADMSEKTNEHGFFTGPRLMEELGEYRKEWYADADPRYGHILEWPGSWSELLGVFDDGRVTRRQKAFADLLDRKKALVQERGNLRRAIATHGRSLKKKENE